MKQSTPLRVGESQIIQATMQPLMLPMPLSNSTGTSFPSIVESVEKLTVTEKASICGLREGQRM